MSIEDIAPIRIPASQRRMVPSFIEQDLFANGGYPNSLGLILYEVEGRSLATSESLKVAFHREFKGPDPEKPEETKPLTVQWQRLDQHIRDDGEAAEGLFSVAVSDRCSYKSASELFADISEEDSVVRSSSYPQLTQKGYRPYATSMPCRAAEAPLKLFDVEDYTGLLSAVEAFKSETDIINLTDPQVFFGTKGTYFGIHYDSGFITSAQHHLWGNAKEWWCLPYTQLDDFNKFLREYASNLQCEAPTNHLEWFINPEVLIAHGFTVGHIVQRPNQIVLVKPGALHYGTNHGENLCQHASVGNVDWGLFMASHEERVCSCEDNGQFHFGARIKNAVLAEARKRAWGVRRCTVKWNERAANAPAAMRARAANTTRERDARAAGTSNNAANCIRYRENVQAFATPEALAAITAGARARKLLQRRRDQRQAEIQETHPNWSAKACRDEAKRQLTE